MIAVSNHVFLNVYANTITYKLMPESLLIDHSDEGICDCGM